MNKQRKAALATALCTLAGLAAALPSSAQNFVPGATQSQGAPFGAGVSSYPSTAPNNLGHYQQYYSFTGGPINISRIGFFSSADSSGGAVTYNFTARLGTTTRAITDVSAGSFVSTAGSTVVFSGPLATTLTNLGGNTSDLNFSFSPFLFTPTAGTNLLLDIQITGTTVSPAGDQYFLADTATNTNDIFQNYDTSTGLTDIRSGFSAAANNRSPGGLRTTFTSSPAVVPEPSQTAGLMVGALGLLALTAVKRRRASQC